MTRLRLVCAFRGHRWRCRALYEGPTIQYGRGLRNDAGMALSWPECKRCGLSIYVELPE
jgi:hypothetical protein